MTKHYEYICTGCFDDVDIRGFIDIHAVDTECSFCGVATSSDTVAPFQPVVEYIRTCLFREYDDATDWTFLDSDTREHMNVWYDAWDILERVDLRLPRDQDNSLFEALAKDLSDDWWSEPNPFGISHQDQTRINWEWFCEVVKHQRRYFFHDFDDHGGFGIGYPSEVLNQILDYADSTGLITLVPEGLALFRARFEGQAPLFHTQDELGPPPKELAIKPNRMSPPGIPMFYAGDSVQTALKETADCPGSYAVGEFRTTRPCYILDFSNIPPIPGVFHRPSDNPNISPRDALIFLHHVVHEMSLPVQQNKRKCDVAPNSALHGDDGYSHIDYVPTQVVTEFVRSTKTPDGRFVEGIKYPSSRHRGHSSFVIFDPLLRVDCPSINDHGEAETGWLSLNEVIHRPVSRKNLVRWHKCDR